MVEIESRFVKRFCDLPTIIIDSGPPDLLTRERGMRPQVAHVGQGSISCAWSEPPPMQLRLMDHALVMVSCLLLLVFGPFFLV